MYNISQRIKYYRRKKGLTMDAIASALGIRTDNYAKYESGIRNPKDDRIIALSKILGVSYNALNEGVEQRFVDLLSRHAISAALGSVESFNAFYSDMKMSSEAYDVIAEFFNRGDCYFSANDTEYYCKYIENPNLDSMIAMYSAYKSHSEKAEKWVFCTAVYNYLENNDTEMILREAGEKSGNLDPLQFFAINVFIPYLSFIIEAVDLCTNTTIDDFENAFLYDALTPPSDM
ncbi:hypothetical protein FACS1894133_5760 [Clostridia bacterium]|nr:hypothetical protein FACS1894133_5760 [Clostridia bacterium]